MTRKHHTAEYQRNAPIIRKRVKAQHAAGQAVRCWRCPRPIMPGDAFDVGHLPGARGSAMHEMAPEHRGENRADGGRRGAAITNARHAVTVPTTNQTTWPI